LEGDRKRPANLWRSDMADIAPAPVSWLGIEAGNHAQAISGVLSCSRQYKGFSGASWQGLCDPPQ
jgi:hypothetical protein